MFNRLVKMLLILMFPLAVSLLGRSEEKNLLKNPGFEDGSIKWTLKGNCTVDETEAKTGTNSLKISGAKTAIDRNRAFQTVLLDQKKAQAIRASCWIKAAGLNYAPGGKGDLIVALDLVIYFMDGSKPKYLYDPWRLRDRTLLGKWVYKESIYSPEKPIKRIMVLCVNQNNAADVWFDDINLSLAGGNSHAASRTKKPPLIDGKLDDECWQNVPAIKDMTINTGERLAKEQTETMAVYDDNNLYLGIRCLESDIKNIKAKITDHDSWVWRDDSIELFIDLTNSQTNYYHLAVNSNGVTHDAYYMQGGVISDRSWECDWEIKTSVGKTEWIVEAAIPFYSLGIGSHMERVWDRVGSAWGFNICRERYSSGPAEWSCWAPTYGGFHKPEFFGKLTGLNVDFKSYDYELAASAAEAIRAGPAQYETLIEVSVKNLSGKERNLIVEVDLISPTGRTMSKREAIDLADTQKEKITFCPTITEEGKYRLRAKLLDKAESRTYASVQRDIEMFYQPVRVVSIYPVSRGFIFASQKVDKIEVTTQVARDIVSRSNNLRVLLKKVDEKKEIGRKLVRGIRSTEHRMVFPVRELKAGRYEVVAEVLDKKGKISHVAKDTFSKLSSYQNEVRVDKDNVLLINNEPFFPIGWYNVPPDQVDEYATYGFNFIHSIQPAIQCADQLKKILDKAHEHNIKVITYPYPSYRITRSIFNYNKIHLSEEEEQGIREAVSRWKDHPALIGWYIYDEPECHMRSVQPLREVYEIVSQEDPFHPIVGTNNTAAGIHRFGSAADILLPDLYVRVKHDGTWVGDFRHIYGTLDEAHKAAGGKKPVWVVLLANETPGGTTKGLREKTYNELRFETYMAVTHGVKGMTYYRWGYIRTPEVKLGMKEGIVPELKYLSPAILSPEIRKVNTNPRIEDILLKEYQNELYLFAVNREEEREIEFYLPDISSGRKFLQVVSENRKVKVINGRFKDNFDKRGIHIYTTSPRKARLKNTYALDRKIKEAMKGLIKKGNIAHITRGTTTKCSSFQYYLGPDLLVDGIVGGTSYWRIKRGETLPAWAEIRLRNEEDIQKIVIHAENLNGYELKAWVANDWESIALVNDNDKNQTSHPVKSVKTDRIKLVVNSSGVGELRIYEIEIY